MKFLMALLLFSQASFGGLYVPPVSAPSTSRPAGWDASLNFSANSFFAGYTTTATAAGTTTLTVTSSQQQYWTGSTTQTVKLPVTSTLALGVQYIFTNLSSGIVTVQSSGANTIQAMAANTQAVFTVILTSGTGTASWNLVYYPIGTVPIAMGGTGQITKAAAFDALSPLTTGGDLLYGGASGTGTRLANGSAGQYLRSAGTTAAPTWGTVVGAWTAFTPTGSWSTNTTYTGYKRQVGENYEYNIIVATTGAPTSAGLTVNIPDTIDTTKLPANYSNPMLGVAKVLDAGVNEYGVSYVRYSTTTAVDVRVPNVSGTAIIDSQVSQANPFTFGNGDSVHLIFSAPIVGLTN